MRKFFKKGIKRIAYWTWFVIMMPVWTFVEWVSAEEISVKEAFCRFKDAYDELTWGLI